MICGLVKNMGISTKYRISERNRAKLFFEASRYFLDDVSLRSSHINDEEGVFAADIYCHGSCIKSYLLKYERRNLKNSSITSRLYTAIELRLWTHLFGTGKKNFENLPPTSRSIKEHILRAYFYTHVQTNCLAPNKLEVDPSKFGNERN